MIEDNKEPNLYFYNIEDKEIRGKFHSFAKMNPYQLGREERQKNEESDSYEDCPLIKEKIYYKTDDEMQFFMWFVSEFEKGWLSEHKSSNYIPKKARDFSEKLRTLFVNQEIEIKWDNNLLISYKIKIKYIDKEYRYFLFEYVDKSDSQLPEVSGYSEDYSSNTFCIFSD